MKSKTSLFIPLTTMTSLFCFLMGCGSSSSPSNTKQTRNLKSQQASIDFSPTLGASTAPKKSEPTPTNPPIVPKQEQVQPTVEVTNNTTEPLHPQEETGREVIAVQHDMLIHEANDELDRQDEQNRQDERDRQHEQDQTPNEQEHHHVAAAVEEDQDIPLEAAPAIVHSPEPQSPIAENNSLIANQNQDAAPDEQAHNHLDSTDHDSVSSIETAASCLDQESLLSDVQNNDVISNSHNEILIHDDFDKTAEYSSYFKYDGSSELNEDEILEYEGIFLHTTEASHTDDLKYFSNAITLAQKLNKSVITDSITYALLLPVEATHTPEQPRHKSLWSQWPIPPLVTALGISGVIISYVLAKKYPPYSE